MYNKNYLISILFFSLSIITYSQKKINCDKFSEILSGEYILTETSGVFGVIDINGDQIIEPKLTSGPSIGKGAFKQKLKGSGIKFNENIIFGYDNSIQEYVGINLNTKKTIIKGIIDYTSFSEGISIVLTKKENLEHQIFAINNKGEKLFNLPKYSARELKNYGEFSDGIARIPIYLDKKNNIIFKKTKTVYINSLGEIISDKIFDSYGDFNNGLARVSKDVNGITKWGFINKNGNVVIDFLYTNIPTTFNDSIARVETKEKLFGFINTQGKLIIEPKFKYATGFFKGMALVQNDYKDWAIINKKGETLYKLDNITRLALGTNDYSPKRIEIIKQLVNYNILAIEDFRGKKSLINKNGKELLLNKKFRISKFIDNLASTLIVPKHK